MSKGISAVIIAVIVIAVVGIGFYVLQDNPTTDPFYRENTINDIPTPSPSQSPSPSPSPSHTPSNQPQQSPIFTDSRNCESRTVTFISSPIDTSLISVIEPLGELTSSGHIIPGDHGGIQYNPNSSAIDLKAMADGFIVRVERQPASTGFGASSNIENFHVYFEYSCTLFGGYIHVTEFSQEILDADASFKQFVTGPRPSDTKSIYPRIPVNAGQIIGKVQAYGLLGMLTADTNVNLAGFVTPSFYSGEPWKIHAVAPFDYFTEPLKSQLLQKNPRVVEPRGGKIDFDINGKLSGNWFLEGTDYDGDQTKGYCGDYLCPYWNGHLAIVYDYVDPAQIRISIGSDPALAEKTPYGVKGNSPDPATIGVGQTVEYELVPLKDMTSQSGFITYGKPLKTVNDDTRVLGVFLVQMVDDRKIKVEIFSGKTAAEVSGFTSNATIYER